MLAIVCLCCFAQKSNGRSYVFREVIWFPTASCLSWLLHQQCEKTRPPKLHDRLLPLCDMMEWNVCSPWVCDCMMATFSINRLPILHNFLHSFMLKVSGSVLDEDLGFQTDM